jgi:hypothetical protein
MVGGGIFLTTSTLARQYGAPSLLAGYLVAALGCALTALCYAEFAALEPGAGSAYQCARASLGHFPSWLIGCALFLEYSFGSAAVAVLWTGNPHYAAGMVGAATLLLILGIRVSANVNTALVFLKCGTLVAFIAWILYWATGHPAVSPLQGESTAWRSVAGLAVFSYLGFESVSTLGLECRNPQRDIPIGVIGSLAITTLLYLAVIATYAMVPNPIGDGLLGAALATGAGPVGQLINLCVYVGLSTVLLIMMMGQSRIFFAMASDGLLPTTLRQTHTRTSAPNRRHPRHRRPRRHRLPAHPLADALQPRRHRNPHRLHRRRRSHPYPPPSRTQSPAPLPRSLGLDHRPGRHHRQHRAPQQPRHHHRQRTGHLLRHCMFSLVLRPKRDYRIGGGTFWHLHEFCYTLHPN